MNIYQRIAEVMKVVKYVQKDTKVGDGRNSYKAVSHDKVASVLRDACIDQGIVIHPSQISKGMSVDGVTSYGKPKIRFEALFAVSFVNIEKPEDFFVVNIEAHGDDNMDKAPGKALSMATKMAMLKVFMLESGDNEESRSDDGNGKGPAPSANPPHEMYNWSIDFKNKIQQQINNEGMMALINDNETSLNDCTKKMVKDFADTIKARTEGQVKWPDYIKGK